MNTNLLLGIIFYVVGLPLYYFFIKVDPDKPVNTYKYMIKDTFDNLWGTLFILLGTYFLSRYCLNIQTNDDFTIKNTIYIIFATLLITESIEHALSAIKYRRLNKDKSN